MQIVTGWTDRSTGMLVSIEQLVLQKIASFRQSAVECAEAGGLLLGLRRGPHIDILWMTEPQDLDVRHRFSFFREKAIHGEIAKKMWVRTQGQADYIGEWHTHPEAYPSPSTIDTSEWMRLAAARKDCRPFIGIIAGTERFATFSCKPDNIVALTPIEFPNRPL